MSAAVRKKIGVITANPENIYQAKVLEGITAKAAQLNYDVLVFATFVKLNHRNGIYLEGEANIFNIINFDLLDGVIVLAQQFKNDSAELYSQLSELLRTKCHCPVVAVDEDILGFDKATTDDVKSFERITDHVIDEHGYRDIIMLAGDGDSLASRMRIQGFRNSLEAHGITPDESDIILGPFWYSLGEQAARDMAEGKLRVPEAVIAASDYIGLGFVNEAVKHGIKVPDDVIVTGFDGVIESRASEISLTSFIPSIAETGEKALVMLAEKIEKRKIEFEAHFTGKLVCGMSCGCHITNVGRRERDDFGYIAPSDHETDMFKYLDSYMTETLTASHDMDALMDQILRHAYLVDNCIEYFLCTCENWQDIGMDLFGSRTGYTDQVKISVYRCVPEYFHEWGRCDRKPDPYVNTWFKTSQMLPKIFEEEYRDEPAVFYFTPVHFNGRRIGYAVMRFRPENSSINFIYQQWSRNVNNALEMMRVRELLFKKSTRDSMTGLYSRNSLEDHISEQFELSQKNGSMMYVAFIDMNGLKQINDVYGHDAGDDAICALSGAVSSVFIHSRCIRMGGDEFLVLGESADPSKEIESRFAKINRTLDNFNKNSGNPYQVSASYGYCFRKVSDVRDVEEMIREADENMYQYKINYKKENNINIESR